MLLTPQCLINEDQFPYPKTPSLSISLLNNKIIVQAISKDRLLYGESSFDPEEFVIIDGIPTPHQIINPSISIFNDCMWFSEKAFKALKIKSWEFFGKNLDQAYNIERQLLQNNIKCDLAYSAGKIHGAYGGYCGEGKIFLACPPGTGKDIKTKVEHEIRNNG